MIKSVVHVWSLATIGLLLTATGAAAAPTTYGFTSGSVIMRVADTSTGLSILQDSTNTKTLSSVSIPLIGSFVIYDGALGANGTLIDLQIDPISPFALYLDAAIASFKSITVTGASLTDVTGATAAISGAGSFEIDTDITSQVLGTFPDNSTLGPFTVNNVTNASQMIGSLGLSGNQLMLGIFGINLATFDTESNPGGQGISVKADFVFISTVVPEPGTALLLGLGLVGLSTVRSRL